MTYTRWKLTTYEAGTVISRAYFHSEREAQAEAQRRRDQHVGTIRAYAVEREEITV